MKPTAIQSTALLTVAALALAGCSNMTPGENAAAFGAGAGLAAGTIGHAAGLGGWESAALGAGVGTVVAATVYVIAKHQATERQRQLAEERARVYVGKVEQKKTTQKRKPRYIAVDTVKSEKAAPQAKKSVMIYDTQSKEIVGNSVYDVQTTPTVGSTAKFDTYSAEYVGTGH